MTDHAVIEVTRVVCDVVGADWTFPQDHAAAIAANWRRRVAATPEIWNGRVFLLRDGAVEHDAGGPHYRGRCFETDFKTFLGWRDLGFPPLGVRNVFSMAALEGSDGAFVLGEMAPHTAPAGQVYFPSGTPDPGDVVEGGLDLEASARRELQEETGLSPTDVAWGEGMTLVTSPVRLCCMKRAVADRPAADLAERIEAWLACDPQPELARVHVVRGPGDVTSAMPAFVAAYMRHRWGLAAAAR